MTEFLIKDEDLTSLKGKVAIVTGMQHAEAPLQSNLPPYYLSLNRLLIVNL